jgi:tetratricopeptide (TPR) repeat protein
MADADELDEIDAIEEIIEAYQEGEYDRAIELCTRLIEADEWAQPFYFRGASRLEKGDAAGALADLSRAIDLDPDLPSFGYHDRGRALAALGRHQEALADYQRAIALRPDKGSTHNRMGTTLYHLGRLDDALAAYAEAIHLEPSRADFHYDRGAVYLARGQLAEAIADFTRAIDLEPEAHYLFSRGTAHLRRGDHPQALADLQAALEADPDHARALYACGYVHYLTRKHQQAEADFARATELDPALAGWPYDQRWLGEQRGRVEHYLHSRGLGRAKVPERPTWELAPYLALWRVGRRGAGLWVLVGDGPTDHLPAAQAEDPRAAVGAFGQRWQRAADDVLAGRDPEMEVGLRQRWPELGKLLESRADLLRDYAANEGLWA